MMVIAAKPLTFVAHNVALQKILLIQPFASYYFNITSFVKLV
jgi:hypothetical protein